MKTEPKNPAPDDVVSIFSHPYSVFLGKIRIQNGTRKTEQAHQEQPSNKNWNRKELTHSSDRFNNDEKNGTENN